jgi:hypothetical protein
MEERRQLRRFTLRFPCLIFDWNDARGEMLLQTHTANVSVGGAFIETEQRLPPGLSVQLKLLIQRNRMIDIIQESSCISLTGQVVRSDSKGMGLVFDEAYQTMRTVHLLDQCRAVSQWLQQLKTDGESQPIIPMYNPINAFDRESSRLEPAFKN